MKPLLLLLAVMALTAFCGATAQAATPVTRDIANAYYKNCMIQQDPRMTPDGQEALCSCTSVKMSEKMTVEDIQIMGQNTGEGRKKLNYMLTEVYGPCMEYPVQDLVSTQCLSDPKIDMMKLKSDRNALCTCMGKSTGMWFSTQGRRLISRLLTINPNLTDPIGPIMESNDFKRASYDSLVACMSQ